MAERKNKDSEKQDIDLINPSSAGALSIMDFGAIEGTMDRPESLERSTEGTDDIGADDVRLPRLALAQGLSPQITPGDPQYIDGLKLFDMFNDMTNEIYGRGPLTFIPVRRDVRRIEFFPRNSPEGKGVRDLNVPLHDDRLKWSEDEDGNRVPPAATTFVEFVILILRPNKAPEPIVLSIKGTNKWNRRASDGLTTMIKLRRNSAIYAGMYKVDTLTPAKNDSGTFAVPVIKNAGFIPVGTPVGAALYAFAKEFHDSLEGKEIVVEREPGSDDDFPTDETVSPEM